MWELAYFKQSNNFKFKEIFPKYPNQEYFHSRVSVDLIIRIK